MDSWPETLPEKAIQLKQAIQPPLPQKTELPVEFGLELLRNALSPNSWLESGNVTISIQQFLPERLRIKRVHQIKIKLIFDRQLHPPLWAQWTSTRDKNCIFIRGEEETWQVEQFPNESSNQKIVKRNLDYTPISKYCDIFPLFSFTYIPHVLREREEVRDAYVENSLQTSINAVEKQADQYYLIHQLIKKEKRKSTYSEYHIVWWISTVEPFLVEKMICWSRLTDTEEWRVTSALQTEYEVFDDVKVPHYFYSYHNRLKDLSDDFERITFDWNAVNQTSSPESFTEKLLDPKASDLVFDLTKKADEVIGVPIGAPPIEVMAPREPDSLPTYYWFIAANLLLIVIVSLYFILKRKQKQP